MDAVYEQQMLRVLDRLNVHVSMTSNEVLLVLGNEVLDFYTLRESQRVLDKIEDPNLVFIGMILSITYLCDLHLNKRLFHGDIKP